MYFLINYSERIKLCMREQNPPTLLTFELISYPNVNT